MKAPQPGSPNHHWQMLGYWEGAGHSKLPDKIKGNHKPHLWQSISAFTVFIVRGES